MAFQRFVKNVLQHWSAAHTHLVSRQGKPLRNRLRIESLENRHMLSATTFEVTNTDDAGDGSLRAAIELANANEGKDTIRFASRFSDAMQLNSELTITDDLIIRGRGKKHTTVSGQNATRVFRIDANPASPFGPTAETIDVEIRNLTITGGLATDAPGFPAALFPGVGFGGGIYNRGNNVKLVGVTMTDNQAGDGATVALAAGGAIGNEFGGTLTTQHSRFEDNTALGIVIGVGGAISQDLGPTADGEGTDGPTAVITRTSFHGNRAQALASHPDASGAFAAFAGWGLGGAIFNTAGDLTVSHSSFVGNEAQGGVGVAGDDPVLSVGNGGSGSGGAIISSDFSPFDVIGLPGRDATLDVQHSRFTANAAYGGDADGTGTGGPGNGGAIAFGLSFGESFGFVGQAGSVSHSKFRNNVAEGGDGGADGGAGGSGAGGAIVVHGGVQVDVTSSRFINNTAQGGQGAGSESGGEGLGGAIGVDLITLFVPIPGLPFETFTSAVDVSRSTFVHNLAQGGNGGDDGGVGGNGRGGAIGTAGGSTADVSRSLIFRNRAIGGRGGALGGHGGSGQGGGIFNGDNSTTTLSRDIVFFNLAIGGDGQDGGSDGVGQGGGLLNSESGDLTVDRFSLRLTRFNHADEGDNVFGDSTLL